MNRRRFILFVLILTLVMPACATRLPSEVRTQKLITKHFKKYAKEYPATIYGESKVVKVEIEAQMEIRKNFASVEAYLTLQNGNLRKINATVEKKSLLGWRFVSWEDSTGSQSP